MGSFMLAAALTVSHETFQWRANLLPPNEQAQELTGRLALATGPLPDIGFHRIGAVVQS